MITDKKSIVKITNLLNFTRHDFDVFENRLLVLINEHLKQKQGFGIDIEEHRSLTLEFNYSDFGNDISNNRLKDLAEKIISHKIFYEIDKDDWIWLVPIYEARYKNGKFKIKIADSAIKHFLELAKGYTNIDKKSMFSLSSQYAIRMYELISAFLDKKEWTIMVDDLKDLLGLKNTQYKNYRHFEKYILEYSQKELWEHCGVHFTWDIAAKQRKKITALTFHISTKDKQEKIELDNEIKQSIDFISQLNPLEIAQKVQMASAKYTLTPEQVEYIISDSKVFNEFIRIDLIIEAMIEKQKPPKDRTKYLAKSLGLDKIKLTKNEKKF